MLLLFGGITHPEVAYTYVLVSRAVLVFLKCKIADFARIRHLIVDELGSNLNR